MLLDAEEPACQAPLPCRQATALQGRAAAPHSEGLPGARRRCCQGAERAAPCVGGDGHCLGATACRAGAATVQPAHVPQRLGLFFLHPASLLPCAPPAQLLQGDGSAGDSIYGGKFKDEPAALKLKCAACLACCCMTPACLPLVSAWAAIALVAARATCLPCLSALAIVPQGVACRHGAAGVVGMANSGKRHQGGDVLVLPLRLMGVIKPVSSGTYYFLAMPMRLLPSYHCCRSAPVGKNSNTSQFYVTFAAAPQCDGKHVVIGKVCACALAWQHVIARRAELHAVRWRCPAACTSRAHHQALSRGSLHACRNAAGRGGPGCAAADR